MVRVEMELYNADEMRMWVEAYAAIQARRNAETAVRVKRIQENEAARHAAMEAAAADLPDAPPVPFEQVVEAAVIEGPGWSEPEPEITDAMMEAAITAYYKANGFMAARALLDEYEAERIGNVPVEKRAEVYARLTA